MAMPDAVKALFRLEATPLQALTRKVYNVGSFNPSALEFCDRVRRAFPGTEVRFEPDARRQGIVDSWPVDIDDAAARADWGWQPEYDFPRAFDEYLIPAVTGRYHRGNHNAGR